MPVLKVIIIMCIKQSTVEYMLYLTEIFDAGKHLSWRSGAQMLFLMPGAQWNFAENYLQRKNE